VSSTHRGSPSGSNQQRGRKVEQRDAEVVQKASDECALELLVAVVRTIRNCFGIGGVAEMRGAQEVSGEDSLLQSSVQDLTEGADVALTACAEASCRRRRAQ
jgi:hypothetical protein